MERNLDKEKEILGEVEALAATLETELKKKTANPKLVGMFKRCFLNTAQTTMQCRDDGKVFLITGDIEAMWLRDSACQVCHYLPFLDKYPAIKEMVEGIIRMQFYYIKLDPYANAFNPSPNGKCWTRDKTDALPEQELWEWERKYELDSLCYPVFLLWKYYEKTKNKEIFSKEIVEGLFTVLEVFKREQHHEASPYFFIRENCPQSDTLFYEGKGTPVNYTGMIWSGFRPSDDACKYGFHIPSNLFAITVLDYIKEIGRLIDKEELIKKADTISTEVKKGIENFGVIENPVTKEEMYAYEVDGRGNYNLMDDANVPNLLGIPWFTGISPEDVRYKSTRDFVLSAFNPYYFVGDKAKGVGSPHTFNMYIWPIGLCIQGLTSVSEKEKEEMIDTLIHTDADTGFMHESFDVNYPENYSREWFAWANSLFALFIIEAFNLEI